jgi:hypothetical protein
MATIAILTPAVPSTITAPSTPKAACLQISALLIKTPPTSSSSGFNSMGLVMGAGMLGGSALLMNASRLATLRAGGHPMAGGNSQKAYHEAMVKAERRRKEQEDKINRELQAAHEDNMRKRGQFKRPAESESVRGEAENMAARPGNGQSFERPGISEAGLASDKFQKQEEIPGDSAQALSF